MKKILFSLSMLLALFALKADEGMWMLNELNRQSAARMQELGFTFPIDSLYSEENPSLKDAVVIFGGGCTGVAVSDQGLIFTNHHCGFDAIQGHSSVEHDYLKDGFVSQSKEEELYTEGLTIKFVRKTEDVTNLVIGSLSDTLTEQERDKQIELTIEEITSKYNSDDFTQAIVLPFYSGNKYFLVIYDVFKDVRMVFAPPSSIGKFGDETDNWVWPRHTGDFSVFRVYADKDNKPANYSADNVPYVPKYSVPVSLKGYQENDYAMVMGFPGSTERYRSSWGIRQLVESEHKPRIEVRGEKQAIWKEAMNADDAIRIKYASKYARSSNYWKNAIGMNEAIRKLHVVEDKEALEDRFERWVAGNGERSEKYGNALNLMKAGYKMTMDSEKIFTYFIETFVSGIEIGRFGASFISVKGMDQDEAESYINKRLKTVYKDYEPALDKKVMPVLLKLYADRVPKEYLPEVYNTINKKFKGDYNKYADWVFSNTKFTDLDQAIEFTKKAKEKDFQKDPVIELAASINLMAEKFNPVFAEYYPSITKGERLFLAGLIEMQPDKAFYSDANFTQRLTYGSVKSYKPADAVTYDYYTTTKGIFEKEKPGDPEFNVQQYILDDLRTQNWGQYADKDGSLHTCFLSTNDITGGNSGSPVFNGKAELIGLAFDGNWESLSGDITFNPEVQRCINVDIRYVIYVIDKVMNCHRLVEELKFSK
ncbi:S46 family peptidase [Dysgonomonas sp. 520]|uniref:S46 family peptidase n=1 Tax=Dysgonomonas sp. 520 TaxID=2302931 RepID=UPI0013D39154|nr:S46 family peptidase [Dysgonomonas sp. 520]NDW09975.1 S46 family peptidase [Dysgonomonas sp. 520]